MQVIALASLKLEQFFPGSKKWVLRNLIVRAFVRVDVIVKLNLAKGPLIKGLGFGKMSCQEFVGALSQI